ncbi:MAG: ferredoxin [Spirochaetales bacterium]|nr:ferredoxin [Spirochaetales bacterium]
MADFSKQSNLNAPGKYYVDLNCICCGICTLFAPLNLSINTNLERGYIQKQAETTEESEAIIKAMRNCPVNAIGDDGDRFEK